MTKKTDQTNQNAKIAEFRFALIAPAIHHLYPDETESAYFKRITETPFILPNGSEVYYSYKTLGNWKRAYLSRGLNALMPTQRSDRGNSRALTDDSISEIYRVKEEFPRMNATQIYHHLVKEGFLPATVSVDSVQRFIRINDLKSARNPNLRDRKAFEEDSFGKMWQADTCYFPYITEDGKSRRVYCIMIIDDHSRLLVGGGLFYNDNALNFQKVLKQAVSTYGIPDKLYVDNGCSYSNAQLSMICVSLGIVLLHTKVRDGASKGKVERHFRTMKERWLYTLDMENITSLTQFNELLKEYMRDYNTTYHRGIDDIPLNRYKSTVERVRVPKSSDWLDECFQNRITRKVRNDSTITFETKCFDVPMQFIGQTVEVRFIPDDLEKAYILYENKHFPLKVTNREENCKTKRSNAPSIDYGKIGGSHV